MQPHIQLRCATQLSGSAPRGPVGVCRRGLALSRGPGRRWRRVSSCSFHARAHLGRPEHSTEAGPAGSAGKPEQRPAKAEDESLLFQAASLSTGFPVPTGYTVGGGIYSYWRRAEQGKARPSSTGAPAADGASSHQAGSPGSPSQGATQLPASSAYPQPPAQPCGAPAAKGADSTQEHASDEWEGYLQMLETMQLQPGRGPGQPGAFAAVGHSWKGQAGPAGARQELDGEDGEVDAVPSTGSVRPVFRVAPFEAELARQRQHASTVRILFLDEGNSCRSVLAVATMQHMLSRLRVPLDVTVESASIGWAVPGPHDPRVARIARDMALTLQPRTVREFDELEDIVQYDLVLVMDAFDLQEVTKEVAVLERINPQGLYSTRVARLGSFGAASLRIIPGRLADDIPDPFYFATSNTAELVALRATVHSIAFACRGLMHCLAQLRARSPPGMSLRRALAVTLQCPLLFPGVMRGRERLAEKWRPVWQQGGNLYTIRWRGQKRQVVRRCSSGKAWGYWRDPANVEEELRQWMAQFDPAAEHLPTVQQLRASGANTLAASITRLGGLAAFSRRIGLPLAARRPNGYWDNFANLAAELAPFLQASTAAAAELATGSPAATAQRRGEGGGAPAGAPRRLRPSRLRAALPHQQQVGGRSRAADTGARSPVLGPRPQPVFPRQQELISAGRYDLVYAIRMHGGRAEVAQRLGASLDRDPPRTAEQVCQQLRCFMAQQAAQQAQQHQGPERKAPTRGAGSFRRACTGLGALLPTKTELYRAGRADLAIAVKRFGGFYYFAGLLGLEEGGAAAASGSGADSGAAGAEAAAAAGGCSGSLEAREPEAGSTAADAPAPSSNSGSGLAASGRQQHLGNGDAHAEPAVAALGACSGAQGSQAADLGSIELQPGPGRGRRARSSSSNSSAASVASLPDLSVAMAEVPLGPLAGSLQGSDCGGPAPDVEATTAGPGSGPAGTSLSLPALSEQPPLLAATGVHGPGPGVGGGGGARRVGSCCPPPPMLLSVADAMLAFMQSAGLDGTLPSRQQLMDAGRRDLANAVMRCGGMRRLAEHLGLELEERRGRKPKHARANSSPLPRLPETALVDDFVLI